MNQEAIYNLYTLVVCASIGIMALGIGYAIGTGVQTIMKLDKSCKGYGEYKKSVDRFRVGK